jgi:hypothetical protein
VILLPGIARAGEKFPPAPVGDDIAYVQLGTVGELVSIDFYRAAAKRSGLFTVSERKRLLQMGNQKAKQWDKLNEALGPEDMIDDQSFTVALSKDAMSTRKGILHLGQRLERLLVGLYLGGVQSAQDPPTRLLLGERLAADMQNLTWLRGLRGTPNYLRVPGPMSIEYVGIQFDQFLTTPGVAPS